MSLEFRILGPLEVAGVTGPLRLGGPKQRGVLAILLLRANQVVPVDEIASAIYGEDAPATAVAQIRDHVSQLRKLLFGGEAAVDGSALETCAPGYRLHVDPEQLDAMRFEKRTREAAAALDRGEAGLAADWLREALGLWRGPPLADFAFEEFAQGEITRLEELRVVALERRIEADLALGGDESLVAELHALVREHPLRERLRMQLMLALYRAGRQVEALDLYHATRRSLTDELGIEPSEELRDLAGRILRHDPSLAVSREPPKDTRSSEPLPLARNPYKGLRAFDEADAPDFFGREALTRRLVEQLAESRFVAVVGPSGSGKSSLVRAGVLPAIRKGVLGGSEAWRIAVLAPGAYPLEELEAVLLQIAVNPPTSLMEQLSDDRGLRRAVKRVLPSDRSELVLLIDQLEELFTLVSDEEQRTRFLAMIQRAVCDPASRLRVIVTLRADFYDRPLLYRGFAELMRESLVTVTPLTPEEIERAVSGPAARAGVELEQGLLAEIVADVLDQPGALPLLQHALTELFERREDGSLNRATYAAIGGVSGALALTAEDLYARFGSGGHDAARQLFLQLVTLGEFADTCRRVERAELDSLDVDRDVLAECIDRFGAARLLSFDRDPRTGRPSVEIAHEALLSEWGRLREWIDTARDDLRAHLQLAAAATEWKESQRDSSVLLRGSKLARFESWAAESGLARTHLERDFLTASVDEREAERRTEDSRRAREAALERRSLDRLRVIVIVLAAASVVAAVLTVVAFGERSSSQRQARIAEVRGLASAAVANLEVDPELSMLLARQAVRSASVDDGTLPEAADALHRAVTASRVVQTIRHPATTAVAFSPDGFRIATAGAPRKEAYIWDARSGDRLVTLKGATAPIHDIAYDRSSTRLVTASENGDVIVWDATTGLRLFVLHDVGTSGTVPVVEFSPDGVWLGAVDQTGRVRIWDARSRRLVRTIRADHGLCGLSWSADGTRIGTGQCGSSRAPAGRVWDTRTGRVLFTTSGQRDAVFGLALSPDGRRAASGDFDGNARIWDAETGRLIATLRGHVGAVLDVLYSPDGRLIATSGIDATARVWDASSGAPLLVLHGHSAGVGHLSFARESRRLATGSEDGTARVWDVSLEGGRDWLTLVGRGAPVDTLEYSRDGAQLLAISNGPSTARRRVAFAHVWSSRTGALVRSYRLFSDEALQAGFSPEGRISTYVPEATSLDGTMVAVALTDDTGTSTGAVEVYGASQRLVARLPGRHRGVQSIVFDPEGKLIATGNWDGTAVVWNVRSGRALHTFAAHNGVVESVAFSPDGALLATAGDDTSTKLWDLATGRRMLTLHGQTSAVVLAFSPDGTRLAAGGLDGAVRVYVLPTDELMAISGTRLTRGWSAAECARYLAGGQCPLEP